MSQKVEYKKRKPAEERLVSELKGDDSRVVVIGEITSVDASSFLATLRDPSGTLTLLFPRDDMMEDVREGMIVRVIGFPLAHDEGFELKAEIIQDFSGFDMELYERYMTLEKNKV